MPILRRALPSAPQYSDKAFLLLLGIKTPSHADEASHTSLLVLARTAERFDVGRMWPGLISAGLGRAAIQAIHRKAAVSHLGGSDYLPLLRWLVESVLRDPTTAIQVYPAGLVDLFVLVMSSYDRRPEPVVEIESQVEIDFTRSQDLH